MLSPFSAKFPDAVRKGRQPLEGGSRSKLAKLVRLVAAVRNWPRTLIDHLHLTTRPYVCELRNGCRFEVRGGSDDRHIIFEVFVDGVYPIQVSRGDTVVDIGAHIGCITVWAARQGARVLSFEPSPTNFEILQRNVRLNGLSEALLFQAAICGKQGLGQLLLPDRTVHTGRASLHPGRGSRTVEVSCVSLDQIVREQRLTRIDLLKIDCEGSEYEILYGASPELLAKTHRIMVECELFDDPPAWTLPRLRTYLEDRGFSTRTRANLLYAERPPAPPALGHTTAS